MVLTNKLSSEEKNALRELRDRIDISLSPKLKGDSTLLYRFLKARDFNVDKAEKMLLKHITWRKIYQIDTILNDFQPKEYFVKYCTASYIGSDKDGDCIFYLSCGKVESSDIVKCDTISNIAKSLAWFIEKCIDLKEKQNEKTNRQCVSISVIIDVDKVSLSAMINKASSKLWLLLTHILQDNYPELMKAVYVINAPSYFLLLFTILKAVMSNATLQKIRIWGNNGWEEPLLDAIDEDVLPAFLGGKRTDPDGNPLCPSFVRHRCDKVDTKYYIKFEDRYFKNASQVPYVVVPPSEKAEIFIDVAGNRSLIQWEFFVKGNDIGFGLFFQGEKRKETIIPLMKFSTADGNEKGFYRSQSIGKYIIIFDNSHSWLSSKEVLYRVMVNEPE